ncbi:MMPL family transporter [Phytomonospora sp. NPDC050363]|uniref:MMPL family transporter n=1 Tax=Phytomonospora sp. NPDC050363 TaxID=3155642 RepID=UPI0034112682
MSLWQRVAAAPGTRLGKWPALAAWVLLAFVGLTLGGELDSVTTDEQTAWLPGDAESTRAVALASAEFPDSGGDPLIVVYARPGGITDGDTTAVAADLAALSTMAPAGSEVPPPIPSQDGEALMIVVPVPPEAIAEDNVEAIVATAKEAVGNGLPAGLDARLTGPVAAEADFGAAFDAVDGALMAVTAAVVALLLLITYRSPLLLLLPLGSVALASQLSNAIVYLLADTTGMVVNPQNSGILTVLVFGVGTDYALLLISRYREELRRHRDAYAAMRVALPRSLPAILASGATVVLAMLVLVFADLNSTSSLGPVAAVGVACGLLAMVTLLPALLVLCGRRVFWPLVPAYDPAHQGEAAPNRIWSGVARFVRARPRAVWVTTALALAVLTLGATSLSGGLDQNDVFTTKPDSVRGLELLAAHYPAGSADPVEVYVPAAQRAAATAAVENTPGVAELLEAEVSADGSWIRLPALLADDPGTQAAEDVVLALRGELDTAAPEALVGGTTASNLDIGVTMDRDLALVIPLVLLVVGLVLVALLRAVVAPLLLLASVVLSFGSALGATGLILKALGHHRIDGTMPLMGFLFLVALGVDYTIFLMSRAKEEAAVHGHREGMSRALTATGGVITSAGIVLAATFCVLAVMPVVFMLQIGVVVAVGVLLDTFVVRSLLVPALSLDVGRATWWPGRLARRRAVAPETREPVRAG